MKNCTAATVSSDLPNWLQTAYSPTTTHSPPPRGRHRSSYSTVSEDAPASFHNSFVSPLPPLQAERTPSPSKFSYEDGSQQNYQRTDLSTVRPKHYFDLMNSRYQGLMTHLPYYQAYYKSLSKEGFGIHEGMCSNSLKSRDSTLRREGRQLSLEPVQPRSQPKLRYSPKSDLKRSFDSALFVAKSYRVRFPGIKQRKKQQAGQEQVKLMRELDDFDRRRKAEGK